MNDLRVALSEVTNQLPPDDVRRALAELPSREESVLRMRLWGTRRGPLSPRVIARRLGVPVESVEELEAAALASLSAKFGIVQRESAPTSVSGQEAIEAIKKLTPELVLHLQRKNDDLRKLNPYVFECLVGELLAANGFDAVRLVGRNTDTSADILAVKYASGIGVPIRFFVEVKRYKKRIGIEIINQVLGAVLHERPRHGWHVAMIVTLAGVKELRSTTPEKLELLGLIVKNEKHLIEWLRSYRQSSRGLWLPTTDSTAPDFHNCPEGLTDIPRDSSGRR